MNDRLRRFWEGRCGPDALCRFLVLVWIVFGILNLYFHAVWIYVFELVLCVITLFRMLSKNLVRRRRENAAYFALSQRVKMRLSHLLLSVRDRKTARYFFCPHCHAHIRMPRKAGRFHVRCQRCGTVFTKEFKR